MIYNSILETIGRTPIVRINRLARRAWRVRQDRGLQPHVLGQGQAGLGDHRGRGAEGPAKPDSGQMVVEATSGNTGIALAMVCAARGYQSSPS